MASARRSARASAGARAVPVLRSGSVTVTGTAAHAAIGPVRRAAHTLSRALALPLDRRACVNVVAARRVRVASDAGRVAHARRCDDAHARGEVRMEVVRGARSRRARRVGGCICGDESPRALPRHGGKVDVAPIPKGEAPRPKESGPRLCLSWQRERAIAVAHELHHRRRWRGRWWQGRRWRRWWWRGRW